MKKNIKKYFVKKEGKKGGKKEIEMMQKLNYEVEFDAVESGD